MGEKAEKIYYANVNSESETFKVNENIELIHIMKINQFSFLDYYFSQMIHFYMILV